MERVLRVSSRPRERDFLRMAKVTAIGILLMGGLGVIISFILHAI
jgi:protein translocase SEC61 complex gamma subunit